MHKAISTNTFHLITNKKLAFENVCHVLKPGGEAAFLFFLDSCFYSLLTALLEKPKFKALHNGSYDPEMYSEEHDAQYYKQMLEEIGFQSVRSIEERSIVCYASEEDCKERNSKDEAGIRKQLEKNLRETTEAKSKLVSELRTMPPCLDLNCPDHTTLTPKTKVNDIDKSSHIRGKIKVTQMTLSCPVKQPDRSPQLQFLNLL
ncbi:hypothetical protein TNIN_222291 [Trichonephila inaurata madagascariensis]|uniref:Uncharacterized protein n=1 Tax=Trichonephila inaurata madagascariensis TaxID=2747483 RepID=A0A8X7C440_9ARAC|nr:hypothetical protein TNIN_222291 [Trichonephila inaurata madagascariensis]